MNFQDVNLLSEFAICIKNSIVSMPKLLNNSAGIEETHRYMSEVNVLCRNLIQISRNFDKISKINKSSLPKLAENI